MRSVRLVVRGAYVVAIKGNSGDSSVGSVSEYIYFWNFACLAFSIQVWLPHLYLAFPGAALLPPALSGASNRLSRFQSPQPPISGILLIWAIC